jgi:subtilisin family serine protease
MADTPRGTRPEDAARADRAAPSHFAKPESFDPVAPWKDWERVELRASSGGAYPYRVQFTVSGLEREKNARYSRLITSAAYKYFKIVEPPPKGQGPSAYLVDRQALRVVYDELIVQFKPRVSLGRRIAILDQTGFRLVEPSSRVKDQWVVRHVKPKNVGASLLKEADSFAQFKKEVVFAWPNSVAEYVRHSSPAPTRDWWLEKIGVNSSSGRALPKGDPGIAIAVLDDGVDVAHPNLVSRVVAGLGRDFIFLPNEAGHSDPRPKIQVASGTDSDYHGTQCAGVVCSDGTTTGFLGVAPGCKLIPVRVVDGDDLIGESRLAKAIVYATGFADVISCSWGGIAHAAVVTAINDTILGRDGNGTVIVGSSGNEGSSKVAFPARHSRAIAVGACGPQYQVTPYSNTGKQLAVVAPSSMNNFNVHSTDVSQPGWGYNTGDQDDPDGLFSDSFGETSAAAAITAGVAALCLSVNPNLTAAEVRTVLQETADPVGGPDVKYNAQTGHSNKFGYGCINAAAAYQKAKDKIGSS